VYHAEPFCNSFSLADFAVHGFIFLDCYLEGLVVDCYVIFLLYLLFIGSTYASLRHALLLGKDCVFLFNGTKMVLPEAPTDLPLYRFLHRTTIRIQICQPCRTAHSSHQKTLTKLLCQMKPCFFFLYFTVLKQQHAFCVGCNLAVMCDYDDCGALFEV
jgi:hypothetical protein